MKKPATRPRGFTTVTASLAVSNVPEMLNFLHTAFDAIVQFKDDDNPVFASAKMGNAMVFVTKGWGAHGHMPNTSTTSAVSLHLYVEDIDSAVNQAVSAGAVLISEPQDMYWGERTAALSDPFGHRWTVAERVEMLDRDEIAARLAQTNTTAETSEAVDVTAGS